MQGSVLGVRIKKMKGVPTVECEELTLVEGHGIEGDLYYGDTSRGKRQVLLLDEGTLREEGYEQGMLREQMLLDLPGLQSLEPGSRLTVGTAELEITFDCTPCLTMAGYVNENGQDFVRKMMGRRGMLARVIGSGTVRSGDTVRVVK